jgi:23S rRNA pseudouridine2605 synthase
MERKRLSKALASAGIASRRACEEFIFAGRVEVNGMIVKIPQTLIDWDTDQIKVDGELVSKEQKKVYYMVNKPRGFICSSLRPGNKPIVLDLFPHSRERLFTVGRLDKESSGLLIVTSDGHFAHQVIHPSSGIIKEYLVKTAQEITIETLKTLAEGALIDQGTGNRRKGRKWVRPVSVHKVRRGTFLICLKEGKKHEVRIIAERASLEILELKRIRIGSLTLGSLSEGEFRILSEKDKALIFDRIAPKKPTLSAKKIGRQKTDTVAE